MRLLASFVSVYLLSACTHFSETTQQSVDVTPSMNEALVAIALPEPEIVLGDVEYDNSEQLKYQNIKVKLVVKGDMPADFKALRQQAREEAVYIAAKSVNSYENTSIALPSETQSEQIKALNQRSLGEIMAISKIQQQSCLVLGVDNNQLHLRCETEVDVPITVME